ncbi:Cytochrome c biogenesis protein [Rhodopirellula islandica]|uniref:Cytochrome c biogenesis protein n=1 Tax=Rhodopirellula islandica TaxID=595434 RepID=A0A0J1EPY8_RHOIS|nr:aromatic aminobenezylarsenical efflux permease ArsG family transporter [Rhodopirellula islandica]KLU07549.1 Cytochrome c biogenesis protein [Rhodopirellula islandica]
MNGYWIAAGSALWLGILTSISPCPLATNIAAVSYVSRNLGQSWKTVVSSLLYTFGRVLAYTVLGTLVVASLLSAPGLAVGLQKYLNLFLGPLLILVGMILLGLIELPTGSGQGIQRLREKFEKLGFVGSALLGILFALSFCPVSAALFFGSLIPLAVKNDSSAFLPALYGVGTGLPVLVFAILLVFGKQSFSAFFTKVTHAETWLRRITGGSILAVGIYITIQQVYLS